MRKIEIICIGTLKEKYLRDAADEYIKRLSPYCSLFITELGETKIGDKATDSDIKHVIESEGNLILSKIPSGASVVTMCIEGRQFSSEDFSEQISSLMSDETHSELCFVIGGSYGLSDAVKQRSSLKLSLSKMTFTHQISRVLLLEQIYRAFQIKTGGKYHK